MQRRLDKRVSTLEAKVGTPSAALERFEERLLRLSEDEIIERFERFHRPDPFEAMRSYDA